MISIILIITPYNATKPVQGLPSFTFIDHDGFNEFVILLSNLYHFLFFRVTFASILVARFRTNAYSLKNLNIIQNIILGTIKHMNALINKLIHPSSGRKLQAKMVQTDAKAVINTYKSILR